VTWDRMKNKNMIKMKECRKDDKEKKIGKRIVEEIVCKEKQN